MKPQDLAKILTSPFLMKIYPLLQAQISFLYGDFHSWNEAMCASTGYDSEIILEKTKTALLKVKSGDVAYERDSVLFDKIQYAWPVLAGLLWVAARSGGRLNVMDFGGSLGSSYYQNQAFLSSLPVAARWNIVEQSKHVGIGKAHFEDDCLRFYKSIAECLTDTRPNIVLLSSALQYLEHPYKIFDQIQELPCDHIIIDRTPFWDGLCDRLCVQTVPPSIYPASYPSWIFSRQQFFSNLHDDWHVLVTFDDPDKLAGPVKFAYQGVIIARKEKIS
jgi:putative methyltransferase (TIGR04325 family)